MLKPALPTRYPRWYWLPASSTPASRRGRCRSSPGRAAPWRRAGRRPAYARSANLPLVRRQRTSAPWFRVPGWTTRRTRFPGSQGCWPAC